MTFLKGNEEMKENQMTNNVFERLGKVSAIGLTLLTVTLVILILLEVAAWGIGNKWYHWSIISQAYSDNPQRWDTYRIHWGKSNFVSKKGAIKNNSLGYRNHEIK